MRIAYPALANPLFLYASTFSEDRQTKKAGFDHRTESSGHQERDFQAGGKNLFIKSVELLGYWGKFLACL